MESEPIDALTAEPGPIDMLSLWRQSPIDALRLWGQNTQNHPFVHSLNHLSCGKCLLLIVSGPTESLKTSLLAQAGNELVTGFERPIPRHKQSSEAMSLFLYPEGTMHLNWGRGAYTGNPQAQLVPWSFFLRDAQIGFYRKGPPS